MSVSYVVLARKYRPQSFEDLAGQEHVARTLAGAIAQNRVAHAFLFTGVRGVGKTTSARLLAKCLNCLGADGKATGPTATPCQVCAACTEIAQGNDLDVQEIDGASYNGVDEVRKLQEGLPFRPARDRYKIYIVDEVHMLSNAAWNAFLKTLEEPPPHVKFLFATTEVHKVPVTILSRCQRYDFKLISAEVIARRLTEVLALEKIEAEPGAVMLLARQADGSMRDAMSLLDRVIAFSGERLVEEEVSRVLGVASKRVHLALARAVLDGDPAEVLRVVRSVVEDGVDLVHFAREFVTVLRDVVATLVAEGKPESLKKELVFAPEDELRELGELAQGQRLDDLLRIFHGFSRGFDDMVRQGDIRSSLEMTLVRLSRRPPLLPLDELLGRIGQLEKRLSGGAPLPRGPAGGGPPRTGAAGGGGGGGAMAPRTGGPVARQLVDAPSRMPTHGALALVPPLPTAPTAPHAADSDVHPIQAEWPEPTPAPPPPISIVPSREPPGLVVPEHLDLVSYRTIVERVENEHMALGSTLRNAWLLHVDVEKVVLGFAPDSFYAVQVREADSLEILTAHVRSHYGKPTSVSIDLGSRDDEARLPTLSLLDDRDRAEALRRARAGVENHPMVMAIRRVLGAELREVKVPE